MKRACAALFAFAMLAPGGVAAQTGDPGALTVAYNKTIDITVAGATSAYSVNPSIVEAGLIDGTIQIRGVGAGTTSVIVVTRTGTKTLTVTVNAPQLSVAFGVGGDGGGAPGSGGPELSEGGSYQGSYSSGGGAVTNSFEFHQQEGQTFRRAVLVVATYVSPGTGSSQGTGVPLISYEIKRPGRDVVFLDQSVTTSPLTFEDSLIRGIHFQQGPWSFHAGAASVASFGSYFIPTDPQWVFGATRDFGINAKSDVAANFYDIVNSAGVQSTIDGGLIGSVLYNYHPQPHFLVQGEIGLSHAVGFGASAVYDDPQQHADASILDKPPSFATLVTDAQQGLFGTLDYSRTFSDALSASASAQKSDYDQPSFRENSTTASGNAVYRLNKSFSVTGGALYSGFDSIYPTVFNLKTFALPVAFSYSGGRLSAGVQYQPTTDFSGTLANGYGVNVGYNYARFQIAASYNHNVDIPTVASIFSQVPGLQAALEQAGINVTDPAQLAALLNNAALLASLGFSGLQLDIAPARNDLAVNAGWIVPGTRGQQLNFSFLNSEAQLTKGAFNFRLASLTYMRRLSYGNEVEAFASLLQSSDNTGSSLVNGKSLPSATSRSSQVTYGLTVRHRFGVVPEFLFPTKRGTIEGTVFQDDKLNGSYSNGDSGLGGIEVTLDGDRTARTDASGHYAFTGVPFGSHQVQADVKSAKPFFFTTDSPATAQIGSTVNFGINFVQGQVFGYVTNDAGQGIAGVTVQVQGLDRGATTGSDGRFVIAGVPQGHYLVTAAPDSFPSGYDLSAFTPVSVDVTANAPWPVNLSARALRSVSGTVTVFDPSKHALSPAQFMEVSIPQLGLVAKTDENGVYTLRDLPAGTYTVQVDGGTSAERRTVTMPADPTTMTGVDFRVTVAQVHERLREHQRQQRRQQRKK